MKRSWMLIAGGLAACGGASPEPAPVAEPVADVALAPEPEAPLPPEDAVVVRNFEVPPGKFAEANLSLEAGVAVTAAFRSDGPVEWNVHSHPEDGLAIHREGTGAEGKIPFTAEVGGGYSYLWVNKGDQPVNIVISIELPPGARVVSWVP